MEIQSVKGAVLNLHKSYADGPTECFKAGESPINL